MASSAKPDARLTVIQGDAPLDFDQVFRRFAPYVASIGLRLLGRPSEVDDLVQDVFLAAHRGIHRLRNRAAVKGWLATVAVRTARRKLRLRKMRSMVGLDDALDYASVISTDATQEERVLLGSVYGVLDHLPIEQRLAWALRHIEGERLDRVAQLCRCSLATAKRRIGRAQRAITEALADG